MICVKVKPMDTTSNLNICIEAENLEDVQQNLAERYFAEEAYLIVHVEKSKWALVCDQIGEHRTILRLNSNRIKRELAGKIYSTALKCIDRQKAISVNAATIERSRAASEAKANSNIIHLADFLSQNRT